MSQQGLVDRFDALLPELLADLERLVGCESPSSDLVALSRSADLVAEIGSARLGSPPERIEVEGRPHLCWRLGEGSPRVLLLCHHDTVWPLGTLDEIPCTVDDGVMRGPGCLDMLSGLAMTFHAVAALPEGLLAAGALTLLVTADEELGSPTSRAMIEGEAAGCAAALVMECAADDGSLKIARKGVAIYSVEAVGRAAHAGLEPEKGVNATVELAHQILAITALADEEAGTTVTPTLLEAGTAVNTVPGHGRVHVDVRASTRAELERVNTALLGLSPHLAGAELRVDGGINRAPLEAASSAGLFVRASRVAADLGLPPLTTAAVGGGSDGNLTAGVGVPTLDGLGGVGGGAHAAYEHVVVAELPRRTALLSALIADLLAQPESRPDAAYAARAEEPDEGVAP